MAKVLITGGAGYLGCVITEHLLGKGHEVTVVDNLMYEQESMMHLAHKNEFEFVKGDARDKELMRELIQGQDVIIPLAAIVGAPACKRDTNLAKSINLNSVLLVNNLRNKETQKIIFPTTNSGYGTKTGEVFCTEETDLEPISLYGETKVDAEKAVLQSPNTITLRLATVFGVSSRMRTDLLVNDFTHKAVTDGYIIIFEKDFKRNYIHVRDVARCFQHCIENFDAMKGNAYNVGLDDANLSKQELAEAIKKQVPKFFIHYAEIGKDPDKRNYIVSNDKLAKTGFKCKYSIEDGIKELIKAYKMLGRTKHRNV